MQGDKKWIKNEYLPRLNGKILYVGVLQNYNLHKYVQTPELFETIDIDPEAVKGISPYKHYIGDFIDFKEEYKYDHISMHGLWGDGILYVNQQGSNPKELRPQLTQRVIKMIDKAHNMLNEGGTLQLGPNVQKHIMDGIYDYLTDNGIYEQIYRFRPPGIGHYNYIWWGKKLNNKEFNFQNNNLWETPTIGLFNG
jgi:hypothetical protein